MQVDTIEKDYLYESNLTQNELDSMEQEDRVNHFRKKVRTIKSRANRKAFIRQFQSENPNVAVATEIQREIGTPTTLEDAQAITDSLEVQEDHINLKKGLKKVGKGLKKVAKSKVLKVATAVGTGGASLMADKKTRQKVGKVVKKIGSKMADATVFAPLLPFRPAMVKALKQKGVSVKKGISSLELAKLFVSKVIRNQAFEQFFENELNISMLEQNSEETLNSFENNLVDDALKIVSEIIGFFKKKKDNPTTKADEEIAQEVKKIEADLNKKAMGEEPMTKNEGLIFGLKPMYIVLGIAVLGALIYFLTRKNN